MEDGERHQRVIAPHLRDHEEGIGPLPVPGRRLSCSTKQGSVSLNPSTFKSKDLLFIKLTLKQMRDDTPSVRWLASRGSAPTAANQNHEDHIPSHLFVLPT